jgi:hypothetical protein
MAMVVVTMQVLRRCILVVILGALQTGCGRFWGSSTEPFLLSCRMEGGSEMLLRIDPRLQEVQELDPNTLEEQRRFRTEEPPAELGGGIIDDSTVRISRDEVYWDHRMYRPQYVAEFNTVNLQTLAYRRKSQVEMGSDATVEEEQGICRSPAGPPQAESSAPAGDAAGRRA